MDAQIKEPEAAGGAEGPYPSVQHGEPSVAPEPTPTPEVNTPLPALNIPKDLRVRRNLYTVRPLALQRTWQYSIHTLQACVVYFFLIGFPLWNGAVYSFW